MSREDDILAGLVSVIFTVDGQPVCTLGKDIFEASKLEEPAIFFSGLIKGVRDFSTVLETELKTVTAIGPEFLVKVILSPTHTIESTVQRDIESMVLEERLTGKKPLEQMGWKREHQTGFAIGFEILRIPYYSDLPDFSRSLELLTIRKLAQTFYTDFADRIRQYQFDISSHEVITAIKKHRRGFYVPQIVDVGHPVYSRKMEFTAVHNNNSLVIEDNIEHNSLSPHLTSNILGAIVSTIYSSMDSLFGFTANSNKGDLIIDFGGSDVIGYSLFASGNTISIPGTEQKKTIFLSMMIGEKEKYVMGGKGSISLIVEELRNKVRARANKLPK